MAQRRGFAGFVSDVLIAGWVALRVAVFVGLGLAIFLIAFLGYFTLPFVFIVAALALLGMTGGVRRVARLRTLLRRGRGS